MGWNKKRKTVNPVWRPVSTQSSSNEECVVKEDLITNSKLVSIEHENHIVSVVREMADSTISSSSPPQAEIGAGDAKQVAASPNSTYGMDRLEYVKELPGSSSSLHNSCGARNAVKLSILSKEKPAVSVEVGSSLMHFIKGKKGTTQQRIEQEMGVKIIFPSSKEDIIVIQGNSMDVIFKATEKIQTIVDEAVNGALRYSHFISLPLAIHPELVDKLVKFQLTILGDGHPQDVDGTTMHDDSNEDVSKNENKTHQSEKASDVSVKLEVEGDNHVKVDIANIPLVSYAAKASTSSTLSDLGIDKSIFIRPKALHLTILMLKLWNKDRVRAAAEVLQNISSKLIEVLDNRPLFIRLKGLDILKGSPAKAQVLYAPVEEIGNEGRLLRACQVITDAYVKAGLVLEKDARQKLKLHATVMNTSHRRDRKLRKKKFDSFDARGIIEQFGSEQWGDYQIREAHLSQRFLYDENGYYHCCGSIPLTDDSQVDEPNTLVTQEDRSTATGIVC